MNLTDWIGFTGVTILLVAYFLNLANKIHKDGVIYAILNVIGGAIACTASIRLHYIPFIILETAWTIVSAAAFIKALRNPVN
jgi:hypothetical protein